MQLLKSLQAPIEPDRRFCVAPMMDWTDRHCRYLLRLIFPDALLYTEMVTADAIRHGDRDRLLGFSSFERPLALQVGGNDPANMAAAAEYGQRYGYDEININVGCPSDRVQSGAFGACLMAAQETVAKCVKAMRAAVNIPITVKTRIGIDAHDNYDFLKKFVDIIAAAGCATFIVHARKAWLQGLSPKENREIPPLQYERVYALKRDFPNLNIILNGGVTSVDAIRLHLNHVDGVMVGRQAYENPFALVEIRQSIFARPDLPSREQVVHDYMEYIERQLQQGVFLKHMTRHMLGLYQGMAGARAWRRHLSEYACRPGAGLEVVETALQQVMAPKFISKEQI
jgi:tRNA-dihydrouridine synthase A